jgi:hypothetical protein
LRTARPGTSIRLALVDLLRDSRGELEMGRVGPDAHAVVLYIALERRELRARQRACASGCNVRALCGKKGRVGGRGEWLVT